MEPAYRWAVYTTVFGFLVWLSPHATTSHVSPVLLARSQPQGTKAQSQPRSQSEDAQIQRGRYIVEQVALCAECHTPRDSEGNLEHSQWLQGASTWIRPVRPVLNWAERAPKIGGLPGFSDEQAEAVLENGQGPNGAPLRPPMHIYHMTHDDALAVIAYLRSLQN